VDVGDVVGESEGSGVGEVVGELVGVDVGESVGEVEGGDVVGAPVGPEVGAVVGPLVGLQFVERQKISSALTSTKAFANERARSSSPSLVPRRRDSTHHTAPSVSVISGT
jgi:hypothetical protein